MGIRLIDADALYEVVSDHVTTVSVCPTVDWARGKSQMQEICLEDIANAPTVDRWISVKDMLPELTRQAESDDFLIDYSEYVVVLSEGRNHFPKIGRYAREGLIERWEDTDYDPIPDVTHWMPLPSTEGLCPNRRRRPRNVKRLNECLFCNGKNIPAQYIGEGQRTVWTNLNFLFGGSDGDSKDGIRLENGNLLAFQNSSGEYAEQMIAISYCPFCGVRLKEGANDEKQ